MVVKRSTFDIFVPYVPRLTQRRWPLLSVGLVSATRGCSPLGRRLPVWAGVARLARNVCEPDSKAQSMANDVQGAVRSSANPRRSLNSWFTNVVFALDIQPGRAHSEGSSTCRQDAQPALFGEIGAHAGPFTDFCDRHRFSRMARRDLCWTDVLKEARW